MSEHLLKKIRTEKPLIHNITNQVVMNFTANGLYATGASPLMASEKEEVADIVQLARALVLNIGTITSDVFEAMLIAGKAANKQGIPVVVDPVGVGASAYRQHVMRQLFEEVEISLIRGNASEVASLVSNRSEGKGVEATGANDQEEISRAFYKRYQVPVVITGVVDVFYDGKHMLKNFSGTEALTLVTGAGCLLTAVIASFLAVTEDRFLAVKQALAFYTLASERAYHLEKAPGSFQVAFIDALSGMTDKAIEYESNTEISSDV